jgi:flagellar motor switch protein FliN/FliY
VKKDAVRPVGLDQLTGTRQTPAGAIALGALKEIEMRVSVELGSATLPLRAVLELGPGSIIELDRLIGEPVDILVNHHRFGRGEVVAIGDTFGVRVTEIISPPDDRQDAGQGQAQDEGTA